MGNNFRKEMQKKFIREQKQRTPKLEDLRQKILKEKQEEREDNRMDYGLVFGGRR